MNLKLAAPIRTCDEALPLSNGTMGLLIWDEESTLRLSLDPGDLWNERPSPQRLAVKDRFTWKAMQEMVAADRMAEFNQVAGRSRRDNPRGKRAARIIRNFAGRVPPPWRRHCWRSFAKPPLKLFNSEALPLRPFHRVIRP